MGTPSPVAVLRGHASDVQTICYDSLEGHLVSGDAQGEVRIWSLEDLRPVTMRRLHPLSAGVLSLGLLPGEGGLQFLVTQGRDGVTHLWACGAALDQISPEPLRTFSRTMFSFCRFSLLAAGSSGQAATGGAGGDNELGGEPADDFVASLLQPDQPAAQLTSPLPASPPSDGAEHAAALRQAVAALHACPGAADGVPAALLAIPGDAEQAAEVCCCACGSTLAVLCPHPAGPKLGICLALRLFLGPPLGGARRAVLLAAGYEDGSVAVWDPAAGAKPLALGKLHSKPVMALDVDPGGGGGVSGAAEGRLAAFEVDYAGGAVRRRHAIGARQEGVGDVAVRPDGRIVAAAGWDGRVRLYKRRSGAALAVLKYHTSAATAVAFSPRSFRLATGARDGTIALWDVYAREAQ